MTSIQKPIVFVSSTCYDLKQVRADLKEFIEEVYGFQAMLSEFDSFPIDPCVGTFENCLSNVDQYADVFVLIVGNRYGYVTAQGKSITNLEYLHAKAKGIPIYVFINQELYNQFTVWKNNKDGNYSSIVDNPKVFEFVAEIYDAQKWVYTFETARDIKTTLKNQWSSIFSKGLQYIQKIDSSPHGILNGELPAEAARMVIEQPYAWEYKFFAAVIKCEFDKLQVNRWDYKYGFFSETIKNFDQATLVDNLSSKLHDLMSIVSCIETIVNTALQDALGSPGEPSDLEMIVYLSKQFSFMYQRLVGWGLYFKSLHTDESHYSRLLNLFYDLPASILTQIDEFINMLYKEIMNLPAIDDRQPHNITLTCSIGISNLQEINAEISKLT